MGKKVRSAKGELVDFDLLKIKEQMATAPAPLDVKKRQDFIDRRMRRRLKRKPSTRPAKVSVDVAPKVAETTPEGEQLVTREAPKRTTKQKARPKKS